MLNKKSPERGFIFRMGCHRRTALTDLVAAADVVAVDVETAVGADLDSAVVLVHAG